MKLLVTGATGYLGRRLLARLTDYSIICPCVPGTEHAISALKNVTVISIEDSRFLNSIQDFSPDTVINVAGVYDTQPFMSVLSGNLIFPLTILYCLSDLSLRKWININTSLPRTLSSYSLAKHQLGDWGNYFSSKFAVAFIDIQLEQFYGPSDGRFLSFVVGKLLANEPLELTECTQRRDLIYVDDVCAGIVCLLNSELTGYQSIPLGCGTAPTLKEVVEYCRTVIGSGSSIRYGTVSMRVGEPMLSIADISTMSRLGFAPKWDWKDGLNRMIEEMRK